MKRTGRIVLIGAAAVALFCTALWLNLPISAVLFAQGVAQQAHPVEFDFEIRDGARTRAAADVEFHYSPKTPILGISEHYWSIIAPYRIDTVTRQQHVTAADGHVRFRAPLGLVGLSNFRLQFVTLNGPIATDNPSAFGLTETESHEAPLASRIPAARVDAGDYVFDGSLALWSMTGRTTDPGGRAYSPRGWNATREVIWDDLGAVHARLDLSPYAVPAFQVPAAWERDGWRQDGINHARPGATLTDTRLSMRHGVGVPIPLSGDCPTTPAFALVRGSMLPRWADDATPWLPIAVADWKALLRAHRAPPSAITFIRRRTTPEDGTQLVRVGALRRGEYRLFAACPSPHYDTVAVAWIEIAVVDR